MGSYESGVPNFLTLFSRKREAQKAPAVATQLCEWQRHKAQNEEEERIPWKRSQIGWRERSNPCHQKTEKTCCCCC